MASMSQARDVVVARCSLVVAPADIWTTRIAAPSALQVRLEGTLQSPIRKPDGTYLFLDLPKLNCRLTVKSSLYVPHSQAIDLAALPALNPVVVVPLLPAAGYSYPAAATALAVNLCDESGARVDNAEVKAHALDDSAARARVAQDTLESGESVVRIGSQLGSTVAGETLLIRGQGNEEYVRVAEVLHGGLLRFEQPVSYNYRRGSNLLPAVDTRSASNGLALLPFRGQLPAQFRVKIEACSRGKTVLNEIIAYSGQVRSEQIEL